MSRISDLEMDLQDEILQGELSYHQIAQKYDVPLSWVYEAAGMIIDDQHDQGYHHDSLERDHDEPYEPEGGEDSYLDSSYEDQYDLGDY